MLCNLAGTIGTSGAQWQSWTAERTAYLGLVLQKMLRGYTEAAVSVTSSLVTFVSRFALQVGSLAPWQPHVPYKTLELSAGAQGLSLLDQDTAIPSAWLQ